MKVGNVVMINFDGVVERLKLMLMLSLEVVEDFFDVVDVDNVVDVVDDVDVDDVVEIIFEITNFAICFVHVCLLDVFVTVLVPVCLCTLVTLGLYAGL